MDLYTAGSDRVEPLPYHGMESYPSSLAEKNSEARDPPAAGVREVTVTDPLLR
jgi:hypothetical protein